MICSNCGKECESHISIMVNGPHRNEIESSNCCGAKINSCPCDDATHENCQACQTQRDTEKLYSLSEIEQATTNTGLMGFVKQRFFEELEKMREGRN